MGARPLRLLIATVGLAVAGIASWWGLRPIPVLKSSPADAPSSPPEPLDNRGAVAFHDMIQSTGITFRHHDGATPFNYLPEVMGGGVAWIDYDRDGLPDLFFVQGGPFPPTAPSLTTEPTSRLYRNTGDGTFEDVTTAVGPVTTGYGQGVAVGDYDNDGYPDLFVSRFNGGQLFHNESNGTGRRFRDVTEEAGLFLDGWCTSLRIWRRSRQWLPGPIHLPLSRAGPEELSPLRGGRTERTNPNGLRTASLPGNAQLPFQEQRQRDIQRRERVRRDRAPGKGTWRPDSGSRWGWSV